MGNFQPKRPERKRYLFSGAAALFLVGQAFEPDALTLRGSGVRLKSLTYRAFQSH